MWIYSRSLEAQHFRKQYNAFNVFAAAGVVLFQVDPNYIFGKCNGYKLRHSIQFAVIFYNCDSSKLISIEEG